MKRRLAVILLMVILMLSGLLVFLRANEMNEVDKGDDLLLEYLTEEQARKVQERAHAWVREIVAVTNQLRGQGSVTDEVDEKREMTWEAAEEYLFEELGIRKTMWGRIGYTRAELQIPMLAQNGEDIVIHYQLNLGYNVFWEAPPYGGFGTLSYYITVQGRNRRAGEVERITYDDFWGDAARSRKVSRA